MGISHQQTESMIKTVNHIRLVFWKMMHKMSSERNYQINLNENLITYFLYPSRNVASPKKRLLYMHVDTC